MIKRVSVRQPGIVGGIVGDAKDIATRSVFPDGLFCRCHLKEATVGAVTDEGIAVRQALRAGDPVGVEIRRRAGSVTPGR